MRRSSAVRTQCVRAGCPVNLLQMRLSPSVALRGARLWSRPGGLRRPCLSQNATRMEPLRRSVRRCLPPFPLHRFTSPLPNRPSGTVSLLSCSSPSLGIHSLTLAAYASRSRRVCDRFSLRLQVQCHTLTGYCWCVTGDGKPVSGSSVHNRTPVCSGTGG